MTSKPVAQLFVDLGVDRSHSRPHVSNDPPTPKRSSRLQDSQVLPHVSRPFGSTEDARAFCDTFFGYYNH